MTRHSFFIDPSIEVTKTWFPQITGLDWPVPVSLVCQAMLLVGLHSSGKLSGESCVAPWPKKAGHFDGASVDASLAHTLVASIPSIRIAQAISDLVSIGLGVGMDVFM
ncbi:hypothetical protein GCM10023155_25130 [Bremerella cremea]